MDSPHHTNAFERLSAFTLRVVRPVAEMETACTCGYASSTRARMSFSGMRKMELRGSMRKAFPASASSATARIPSGSGPSASTAVTRSAGSQSTNTIAPSRTRNSASNPIHARFRSCLRLVRSVEGRGARSLGGVRTGRAFAGCRGLLARVISTRRVARGDAGAAEADRLGAMSQDLLSDIRYECFGDRDRPVLLLVVLDDDCEQTRERDRRVVQLVRELELSLGVLVPEVQAPGLEIMEIGRGVRLTVRALRGHPCLE